MALGLFAVAFADAAWQAMRPKIGHATPAEIDAALPPYVRSRPTLKEASMRRMDRVIELAHGFSVDTSYSFGRDGAQGIWQGGNSAVLHPLMAE